jgi:prevent-host-death family protein
MGRRAVPLTRNGDSDRAAARLREMTISGYDMVMKQVRIADLKARLSEYLRAVRRGETISVLDRETPVAQIIPVRDRPTLHVRTPAPGAPPPNRVKLPKPATLGLDVVQLLLEERQGAR